ncbi:MAG: hypothetical protein A2521_03930 [Deltaproteobacteria bacterium RIFOXYD12_FULL_57_12]|nr:MAG: hypothetical protein A2521_03930 [Deltaproteobacteria bacterium RIFOXYD12_FULL_57_12]
MLLILLGAGHLLGGCAAIPKKQVRPLPPPPSVITAMPAPPLAKPVTTEPIAPPAPQAMIHVQRQDIQYVEKRLEIYEEKIKQRSTAGQDETDRQAHPVRTPAVSPCAEKLEELRNGYRSLLSSMRQNSSITLDRAAEVDPRQMLQQDIAYLESDCEETPAGGEPEVQPPPPPVTATNGMERHDGETLIAEYFARGEFASVVSTFQQMIRERPGYEPNPAVKQQYGLALLRTGKTTAAAEVFTEIYQKLSAESDTAAAESNPALADQLLAAGKLATAQSLYEKLTAVTSYQDIDHAWFKVQFATLKTLDPDRQETADFLKLIRDYIFFDGKHGGGALLQKARNFELTYPTRQVAASSRQLQALVTNRLRNWLGSQLVEADKMIAAKEFQQAKNLLQELAAADLPIQLREAVQKTMDELTVATTGSGEQTQLPTETKELAPQWEAATKALDSLQYDEAIKGFRAMMGTEYETRAREKMSEAVELAAADSRKQAAALFAKATKTNNAAQKRELLVSSRQLLLDILKRYPQVKIADKVTQNLQNLEEYIRRFDPSILDKQGSQPASGAETSSDAAR